MSEESTLIDRATNLSPTDPSATDQNEYELVYILKADVPEEKIASHAEQLAQIVNGFDGELLATEHWGQRRLAYPIKKQFEGFYVLQRLRMPARATMSVERICRLNEDVIRFLLLRTDQ